MKINIKAVRLVFRPKLVKQALKNLWEIVDYNLHSPGINEVYNEYVEQNRLPELIKLCFVWIVEEVLPVWVESLTEGHALHLSEINWTSTPKK